MSEKKSCLIGWLIIAVIFAGLFATYKCCDFRIPTGADMEEANRVVNALEQRYSFHQTGERTIFCRPHPDFSEIIVHGSYTPLERDQIIEAAKITRRETATKPVHLQFHDGGAGGVTRTEIIP